MGIPLSLGFVFGVELTFSDIAILVLLILWSQESHSRLLNLPGLLVCLWAFLALVMVSLLQRDAGPLGWHGLGSLAFYLRAVVPLAIGAYRLGALEWRSQQRVFAAVTCGVMLAIVTNVAVSGGHWAYGPIEVAEGVRYGEHLRGGIFGFRVYGSFGIHSLAVTYAMYACVGVVGFLGDRGGWRLIHALAVMLGSWLVITSTSRQALLILFMFGLLRVRSAIKSRATQAIVLLGGGLLAGYGIAIAGRWILRSQEPLVAALNDVSTNRLLIAQRAIDLVLERPLFGTGFYGSQLAIDSANLNTHNIWLSAAFRMGLVGATLLGWAIFRLLSQTNQNGDPDSQGMGELLALTVVVGGLVADPVVLSSVLVPTLTLLTGASARQVIRHDEVAPLRKGTSIASGR